MTDETTIAVEVRNAVKQFGPVGVAVRALDDVSVTIRKGEFFTLLGPSGCGKTTLLRLIAGFETPTSGEILLDGVDITDCRRTSARSTLCSRPMRCFHI